MKLNILNNGFLYMGGNSKSIEIDTNDLSNFIIYDDGTSDLKVIK